VRPDDACLRPARLRFRAGGAETDHRTGDLLRERWSINLVTRGRYAREAEQFRRAIERPMRRRFWRIEINWPLDRPQGQEDQRARLLPRNFSVNTVKNMKFGGGFPKYRRKTSSPSSLNDVSLYLTVA